jgi:uncharacterized protein (TIGR03032 family)
LADAPLLAAGHPDNPGFYRHLLVPRATLFCGDIDAHDLVWIGGRLFAANTRFSCIAEIDGRYSFVPVWQPPFITELLPDDRCHLNGLATVDGRIHYATAFGRTDTRRGWSDDRFHSGVLIEVPSGKIMLDNLCMPHSPRVFDGDLYLLDSGTGRDSCERRRHTWRPNQPLRCPALRAAWTGRGDADRRGCGAG